MKRGDIIELPSLVYSILLEYTDEEHLISMPDLRQYLEDEGMSADRRSVYKAISVLNDHGCVIRFEKRAGIQGYWMEHPLTSSEALFLMSAVSQSRALSEKTADRLNQKILGMLSGTQQDSLPKIVGAPARTENDEVLEMIRILLHAVRERHPVRFRYFDMDPKGTRSYRNNGEAYSRLPLAVVSNNGFFYCVMYSDRHEHSANFRIDKMDGLKIMKEQTDPVRFDLEAHMRSSFDMYTGDPRSIILECDNSVAQALQEHFEERYITRMSYSEKTFTVSIRTAVTPTLTGWLVQYYDRIKVIRPQELQNELVHIGETLLKIYSEGR